VLALAACDDGVRIEPVFELPAPDDDAWPSGLAKLVLSVTRAGDAIGVDSPSFDPGKRIELELSSVPFDEDLVVHLTGRLPGGTIAAYGRTCTFQVRTGIEPPSPHLWFARNVRFATLALAPDPRTGAVAIDINGAAFVVGGGAGSVERFDPRTGELADIGQLTPRTGAVAAPLGPAGAPQLAVIGGAMGDQLTNLLELISPAAGGPALIDRVTNASLARIGATATTLTNGDVVVIGGRGPGGALVGALTEIKIDNGTYPIEDRAALAHPRAEHTATRLGDAVGAMVLIAGGVGNNGSPVAVAELWKPLPGKLASPATFAPTMIVPRRGHRAELMPDGSVLIIGGVDGAGMPVRMLERFVIDVGFEPVGELREMDMLGVVDTTTTRLPDGRILLAGGRLAPGGPAVDTAAIMNLDVENGEVSALPTSRLAVPRAGHYAVLLCDGTVWIGGGTAGGPETERYNPPPDGRR
jgi:hypothetical protein